jgi:REP element-mobilizing transposase RayT
MARPWRIAYENALYHIFSTGNEKREIFHSAQDRVTFIYLAGRMAERFRIDLFAYVLMPNQYDLLLRTQNPNLARAMHWLGTAYTRRFNLRHSRSGHLFQGRYRSTLVENAECLAELSGYIHLKPVRLRFVQDPADYPWSSYNAYAFGTPLPIRIDTGFILSVLSGPDVHRAYREMALKSGQPGARARYKLHHGMLFGSHAFVDEIRRTYLDAAPHPDMPSQRKVFCDQDPQKVLEEAAAAIGPTEYAAIGDCELSQSDLQLLFLWRTGFFKNRDIGSFFGMSQSAVSRRVKTFEERIKGNPSLSAILEAMDRRLKAPSIRRPAIEPQAATPAN